MPCGQCHIRLHREIELRAETTAAGRRDDADVRGGNAQNGRRIIAVEIGRLGRDRDFDAIADAPRPSSFGLDIGMFDEAGFEFTLNHNVAGGKGGLGIATRHAATDEDVTGPVGVKFSGRGCHGLIDGEQRLKFGPFDGEGGKIELIYRGTLTNDGGNCLALEPRFPFGEDRLVGEGGDDAEDVAAGHVAGRQDADETGVLFKKLAGVAKAEGGAVKGRADGAHEERIGWNKVGAECFAAVDLGMTVEPLEAGAHGGTRNWNNVTGCNPHGRIRDRGDDLAITSATAENAAQCVLDLQL